MSLFRLSVQPFKILKNTLPSELLSQTLHKPWMRVRIFLDGGPLSRVPEHYKKFFYDWQVVRPTPIHYIPQKEKWKYDERGKIIPVQNVPILLKYPLELNDGIWGGEAVVKGYLNRKKLVKFARYWYPRLIETVVYSEILNKYIKTIVTPRALNLIDEHYGLDNYIFKTKPADLKSEFVLKLKREMLYTLHRKNLYPDDRMRGEEIYNKYKEFLIPEEEIEWYGLTLAEAYRKQLLIDRAAKETGPYKIIFRQELINHLKNRSKENLESETQEESEKNGILHRLKNFNIFSSSN